MSIIRTCPDCGGILQSTTPDWIGASDARSGAGPDEPALWQCLLCGHEEAADGAEPPLVASDAAASRVDL